MNRAVIQPGNRRCLAWGQTGWRIEHHFLLISKGRCSFDCWAVAALVSLVGRCVLVPIEEKKKIFWTMLNRRTDVLQEKTGADFMVKRLSSRGAISPIIRGFRKDMRS